MQCSSVAWLLLKASTYEHNIQKHTVDKESEYNIIMPIVKIAICYIAYSYMVNIPQALRLAGISFWRSLKVLQ